MHAITNVLFAALILQATPGFAASTPQVSTTPTWSEQTQPKSVHTPPGQTPGTAPQEPRLQDSFTQDHALPEPGSFAFAGMALSAVGLFLRKRP